MFWNKYKKLEERFNGLRETLAARDLVIKNKDFLTNKLINLLRDENESLKQGLRAVSECKSIKIARDISTKTLKITSGQSSVDNVAEV